MPLHAGTRSTHNLESPTRAVGVMKAHDRALRAFSLAKYNKARIISTSLKLDQKIPARCNFTD